MYFMLVRPSICPSRQWTWKSTQSWIIHRMHLHLDSQIGNQWSVKKWRGTVAVLVECWWASLVWKRKECVWIPVSLIKKSTWEKAGQLPRSYESKTINFRHCRIIQIALKRRTNWIRILSNRMHASASKNKNNKIKQKRSGEGQNQWGGRKGARVG